MKIQLAILLTLLLASACTPEPKPIEYGSDPCDYCKMTIVDNQHAAEAVTSKGKVHKFDAIECMVNFCLANEEIKYAHLLVTPYTIPGELASVENSTFLISKSIPSPMGAFLSAFPTVEQANAIKTQKGGEIYDWAALQAHFKEVGPNYFLNNQ